VNPRTFSLGLITEARLTKTLIFDCGIARFLNDMLAYDIFAMFDGASQRREEGLAPCVKNNSTPIIGTRSSALMHGPQRFAPSGVKSLLES
jgi:hypothetical protein